MAKKTIPRTCENCQSPFLAEAHEINKGKARFCSKLCANRFICRGASTRSVCQECGTVFRVWISHAARRRYCTPTCRQVAQKRFDEPRFWAKVMKTGGCWLWTAALVDGYGSVKISQRNRRAHVVSWELHNGPIPKGLSVLHRCDNPPCVNPEHLFLGTQKDNMRDMVRKGRNVGCRKLTPDQVREIRRLYAAGNTTFSEVGSLFGVGVGAINHIVHRRTWTHID